MEDYRVGLERAGRGRHSYLHERLIVMTQLGDVKEAATAYRAMLRERPDDFSPTPADLTDTVVRYLINRGRFAEAVETAGPILAGKMRCTFVPQTTLAKVLFALVRLGRLDEAMACHRRGYPMVERHPALTGFAGLHMSFLALTANHARAVKLFERHFPTALATLETFDRFYFFRESLFTLRRLASAGRDGLALVMPATFPLWRADGRYAFRDLARWVKADLGALAARYDARNGNDAFARKVRAVGRWGQFVRPYPLRRA